MKNKLPLYLENLDLPKENNYVDRNKSFGYINFMYIISLIITGFSIVLILLLGK